MHFGRKSSVRTQVIAWVFAAILFSWLASGIVSTLMMYQQVNAMRQAMLAQPTLYPRAIPEPQIDIWDFILGPKEIAPRMSPRDGRGPRWMRPEAEQPPGPPPGQVERRPGPPQPMRAAGLTRLGWVGIRSAIALLCALLTGVILSRRFAQPLRKLADGAHAYEAGDFAHRIPLHGDDEFAQVAHAMNGMATQVDEQIARLNDDAKRRQQLLADVAHELRNPVMTMRTMSGALSEGLASDPERHARAVDSLLRTSDRMLHLVTDLMDLAKLDLKELPLHKRQVDLREVAAEAIHRHQEAAQHADIRLHALEEGEPIIAVIDPDRIAQVLDNLLDNAISYAGEGAEISVNVEPGSITVADTGKGISADQLPYVFDAFYRVDPARSPKDPHSGLGLRIVKGVVEAHGGTISMESREGEGTRVLVTLPRPF